MTCISVPGWIRVNEVYQCTWLDQGKWDGLLILTCRSETTITEMIPTVACMKETEGQII